MTADAISKLNAGSFGPGREVENYLLVTCPCCSNRNARYYQESVKFECEGCGYFGSASTMYDKYSHLLVYNDEVQSIQYAYTEDDTGNARRLRDKYIGQIIYSHPEKLWRYFNGQFWKADESGEIKRRADQVIAGMAANITAGDPNIKERLRFISKTRSSSGKENMIEESRHLDGMYCDPEEFDKNIYLVNVKNGTYNLLLDSFFDHDPTNKITRMANVRFDESATCPLWDKTIQTVLNNDEGRIRYLKQLCGYFLTGSTKEQMMTFVFGNGRNGKTLVMETITGLLGDYAMSANPEILMVRDRTGGATPEIARLRGARLVLTSETQDGSMLNEGLIKQLTGCDTIVARPLYSNEIQFKPQFKLVMVTNHKPVIRGVDDGIWRRIHLIPFDVKIPDDQVDPDLQMKLIGERSGILNWMIEGFRDYIKCGLIVPAAVQDATEEYRSDMDIFMQFWSECVQVNSNQILRASELYSCYRSWCELNGMKSILNQIRFGREANRIAPSERSMYGKIYPNLSLSAHGSSIFSNSP